MSSSQATTNAFGTATPSLFVPPLNDRVFSRNQLPHFHALPCSHHTNARPAINPPARAPMYSACTPGAAPVVCCAGAVVEDDPEARAVVVDEPVDEPLAAADEEDGDAAEDAGVDAVGEEPDTLDEAVGEWCSLLSCSESWEEGRGVFGAPKVRAVEGLKTGMVYVAGARWVS